MYFRTKTIQIPLLASSLSPFQRGIKEDFALNILKNIFKIQAENE